MSSLVPEGMVFSLGLTTGAQLGAVLILAFYFFVTWDSHRADSPNRADGQIGLKVALYTFFLVAVAFGAIGLARLIHYLLSGAVTGTDSLKSGLAALLTGGMSMLVVWKGLLPRTNDAQFPKAARLAYGTLGAVTGAAAIGALFVLLYQFLVWQDWRAVSGALSDALVATIISIIALAKFGRMCGWVAPQPPAQYPQYPPGYGGAPPGSYPQGGYSPPAGYPPSGGYPPQGGYTPPR